MDGALYRQFNGIAVFDPIPFMYYNIVYPSHGGWRQPFAVKWSTPSIRNFGLCNFLRRIRNFQTAISPEDSRLLYIMYFISCTAARKYGELGKRTWAGTQISKLVVWLDKYNFVYYTGYLCQNLFCEEQFCVFMSSTTHSYTNIMFYYYFYDFFRVSVGSIPLLKHVNNKKLNI